MKNLYNYVIEWAICLSNFSFGKYVHTHLIRDYNTRNIILIQTNQDYILSTFIRNYNMSINQRQSWQRLQNKNKNYQPS